VSADGGSADGGSASADGGSASADGGDSASASGADSLSGSASASDDGSASADGGPAGGDDPCAECPSGLCDELGACWDCVLDSDCLEGWACDPVTHTCDCMHDSQCATDEVCNDIGECVPGDVPGSECVSSTDCDPSLGCGAGYCLRCQGNGNECTDCAVDADCGDVFFCNAELESCVFCVTDYDCDHLAGEVCHPYGECGMPCMGDADCPHDRLCDEHQRCVPPPPGTDCSAPDQCPDGTLCVSGLCKACDLGPDGVLCQACQPGNGGCDDGFLCDYDVFVCVSCRDDDDCSGGTVCQHGACVAA
jgi:hypothetical protein